MGSPRYILFYSVEGRSMRYSARLVWLSLCRVEAWAPLDIFDFIL